MIATYARAAWANGYAATPGPLPLSEASFADYQAALAFADVYAEHPHIIEATIHLGRLSGVWATIIGRRDDLRARNQHLLLTAIRGLRINRRNLVRAATVPHEARSKSVDITTSAAIAGELTRVGAHDHLDSIVETAVRETLAEGSVDATALLELRDAGSLSIDFDLAFTNALDALGNLGQYWARAGAATDDVIRGLEQGIGRAISTGLHDGLTRGELIGLVDASIESPDYAELILDHAISTGLSIGAIDLYQSEGETAWDFLTVGDDRVDDECEAAEADNPHGMDDLDTPPLHPGCRCTVAPVGIGNADAYGSASGEEG